MRVLRLDAWDGPTFGGAEVYIARVSRALEERGHPNVTAVIVTDPPPDGMGPVRAFMVPRSLFRQAVEGFAARDRLAHWLDELANDARPDLIHLHHFHPGFPTLGPWLAGRREPIVFTAHDAELVCPIATLTLPDGSVCPGGILPRCQFTGCDVGFGLPLSLTERYYFDTFVKERVRAYICTSRATQRVFEDLGYRPTELLRPLIPLPDEAGRAPTGPFTIGFLGRFDRQKGIGVLLQAFEILRRAHPEVRIRFAGSGPVPIPKAEGIDVDGWVSDVSEWFGRVHVLVAPSLGWENLGNSAIEALGHGVPVIVSDSGGLPETVGKFGTVVPAGDPEALAAALQRLVEHYDEARQLALAGRAWAQQEFSTESHVQRLLAIYTAARR